MWRKWSSKIKKVILEVSLVLKIYFIYTVYSYLMKNTVHLNFCRFFSPKKSKTLYSGHLVIADTFRCSLYRQSWLYVKLEYDIHDNNNLVKYVSLGIKIGSAFPNRPFKCNKQFSSRNKHKDFFNWLNFGDVKTFFCQLDNHKYFGSDISSKEVTPLIILSLSLRNFANKFFTKRNTNQWLEIIFSMNENFQFL